MSRIRTTVYCDDEELSLVRDAILSVRNWLQEEGEKGDIWLFSEEVDLDDEQS